MSSTKQLLQDIQEQVQAGKYYEAQQMYKGLSDKLIHKKKFDQGIHVLVMGARALMAHRQATLTLELGYALIECFEKSDCTVSEPKFPLTKSTSLSAQGELRILVFLIV